jgi:hydrogenase expression/formation protein HypE
VPTHCLRDLTRGGLASALVEIAETSRLHLSVDDAAITVRDDVQAACEILGFDPMYVANEGRFIAFVPEDAAPEVLRVLARHPVSAGAAVIGRTTESPRRLVSLRSRIGASRVLDRISGEQLPRIC